MKTYTQLPLAHLQLTPRAYNSLYGAGYRTIVDVQNGLTTNSISKFIKESSKSFEDIHQSVEDLNACLQDSGLIDWETFWSKRPPSTSLIAISTPALRQLDEEIRSKPLGVLNLNKATNGLVAAGIHTVGDLIDRCELGLGKLQGLGGTKNVEIINSICALSGAIDPSGDVNWIRFGKLLGISILPSKDFSPDKLLDELPSICRQLIAEGFKKRDQKIFEYRLLKPTQAMTLEAIGKAYGGLTRERIRQIEVKCIESLREPILRDNYRGLRFRLRAGFVSLFKNANAHLEDVGVSAWSKGEWIREVARAFQASETKVQSYWRLISEILGYEHLESPIKGFDSLIFNNATPEKEQKRLRDAAASIHELLLSEIRVWNELEIVASINKTKRLKLDVVDLPSYLTLCPSVESLGDGLYRLNIEYVNGRSNQVYWTLEEEGQPLSRVDLFRILNSRLPVKRRLKDLNGLSSADPRVVPIAKSGKWGLVDWDLDVRTNVEVLKGILDKAGTPLDRAELLAAANKVREFKDHSLSMSLQLRKDIFTKVGPDQFALKEWRMSEHPADQSKPRKPRAQIKRQPEIIEELAVDILLRHPSRETLLRDVVGELESQKGYPRMSIYGALTESGLLEKVFIGDSPAKLLRFKAGRQFSFPKISVLKEEATRKECERAVAKLTDDDVDIALFILGRLFEDAMITLVDCAEKTGKVPVSDWAKQKLHNRVEWGINHNLFKDPPTFRLLKTERNDRAHGVPTTAERQALMKFAPYLSELYIDYIALIESKVEELSR